MRVIPIISIIIFTFPSAARAQVSIPDTLSARCASVYTGALQKIQSNSQLSVTLETMKRHACDASNFNLEAGFDSNTKSIINAVPVVSSLLGSLKIGNNKQFCEAINQGKININQVDTYSVEPVESAMKNANECIAIAAGSGVAITHVSPDPSQVLFSARFGMDDGRTFKFSGLTNGGFQCVAPHTDGAGNDALGKTTIIRSKSFAILCERSGKSSTDGSGDIEFLQGSVSLSASDGNIYSVIVPGDTLYGVQSRRSAQSKIEQVTIDLEKARKDRENEVRRSLGAKQVRYYFHTAHLGPGPGIRFTCANWQSGRPQEIAKAVVCPNGSLIDLQHYAGDGPNCGFNSYSAICVPN